MPLVLIVDDSPLMRKHLQRTLEKAGFTTVLATDGQDCLDKLTNIKPDVITLDVNMPVMDGLTCLGHIMETQPTPVIMLSALTIDGAAATLEALEMGAVDFIPKPQGLYSPNNSNSAGVLVEKIRSAVKHPYIKPRKTQKQTASVRQAQQSNKFISTSNLPPKKIKLIVIGVSTGGPVCLQDILQDLPADYPIPIVVAQHMPARFTEVFTLRLNKICKLKAQEVTDCETLSGGSIYIAKGDADIEISARRGVLYAQSKPTDKNLLWHPSVTKLVNSAVETVKPSELMCIQLTGMGDDGAHAMFTAHEKGAHCIAESQETAVIYGMPKALIELGGANQILPSDAITDALIKCIKHPESIS